jgi:2-polyprenyl-3-methyl-5-hydroxy-6-metoxy-1,4-benzoquinol methylase
MMGAKRYEKPDVFYCHSCGGKRTNDVWPSADANNISVRWCNNCGLGKLNPFPTMETLSQIYAHQPVYGLPFIEESQGGFSKRIKRLSKLNPQRGRLLDIGSGLGHFLQVAKSDGWQVDGVEPRPEAVKYCYEKFGINVHEGFLEDLKCSPASYDVITLWDVLEHVYDPFQFIQRCVDLLSPDGLMVLAIPNASGWPARLFKCHWRYVMPTHLHYFKMLYINRLLSKNKMQIERADHTFKVHSLVQSILSMLPFNISVNRIFQIGMDGDNNRKNKMPDKNSLKTPKKSPLKKARKIVFKLNMISYPWAIADMMDLYCRKKSVNE